MISVLLAAPLTLAAAKITALLGAALLLLPALRRSSAAARHTLCLCALVGSVLLIPVSFTPSTLAPVAIEVRTASPSVAAGASNPIPWGSMLLAAWCVGAFFVAARYAGAFVAARGIVANSTPVEHESWRAELDALPPHVQLRFAHLDTAVTCGLFRPVILLPREAAGWEPSHRIAVVMHELAHIRRRDLWSGAAAALVTSILWFHPFAWILARRLREEQECACDDAVLNQGVAPSFYAELLLESARAGGSAESLFACAMTGRYAFRSRLVHILDPARVRRTRRATLKAIGAGAVLTVASLSLVRPVFADDVYPIGGDVKPPRLIHKVEPEYTQAAKDAKIEGAVHVEAVVGTNGRIRDARIIQSLDAGLDNCALDALNQWLFEPGTRKGEPVAVRAKIEIHFRLL